ncbi:L-aspartate oxidase [Fluviispira multicolorata]|uniref:L-aspartate oxidase n=1 Tax=Fluviispira multicolorata TaxID=2654512 RepID=A0A833N252_9BACT|nr:L-aspartate oxidase [Fluviispira multicolorata]KAB8031987.1 L-aspartate oxidase [Fluviispira multicolorata]
MKKKSSLQVIDNVTFDFLIIGSGVAGASLALKLSAYGKVGLLCKESFFECNTRWAQGGIASVLSENDSYNLHIKDTLIAGAGLCHEKTVEKVIGAGPNTIKQLINLGVQFTQNSNENRLYYEYHLTKEGGHSARRIIHAADMTGIALQDTLSSKVTENKNIVLLEYHTAIDLIVTDKVTPDFSRNRALGAYVLNEKSKCIYAILAKATILATGGHGKLYLYTSNPDVASGDGVAMAWRAGARVANLEFMQFHPTCLYSPKTKNFLISEALRGEGALLKTLDGQRFMENIHPLKELAPRDIVARAIDSQIKKSGDPYVLLDISHKEPEFIKTHFPGIYAKCLEIGLDITQNAIPVVPAAHYSCGGIVTDIRGRTGIKSLWALGEVACTGLHGANRLASNSLLEGLVFADFVYEDIKNLLSDLNLYRNPDVPKWELGTAAEPDEMVVISQLWDEIRRTMWNYVGIVRTEKRLARAAARIDQICQEIETYYWNIIPSRSLIEVRNLATVAQLTVKCARMRKESRGIHYSLDYPLTDDIKYKKDTVVLS